jgi:peptide/nickel transport system permease protein
LVRYVVGRILQLPIVLFVVSVIVFALLRLTPGDPVQSALGVQASPETIAALRARLGLDEPLVVQYLQWLLAVLRADLGRSMLSDQSVAVLVAERLPVTLTLAVSATLLSVAASIPLGLLSAIRPGSLAERVGTIFGTLGIAVPNFVFALVLILLFAVMWPVLPIGGWVSPLQDPLDGLRHLVLPTIALSAVYVALLSRLVQVSVAEVLPQDYVRTARSKGLAERVVIRRHVLGSALLPVITAVAINFAYLLGGAIIIEQIFFIPGLGRLIIDAALQRDYTIIQGATLVTSLVFLLSSLLADLAYATLDPRIRYQG